MKKEKYKSLKNRISNLNIQITINERNNLHNKIKKYLDKNLDLIDEYNGNNLIEENVKSMMIKLNKLSRKAAKLVDNKKYKYDVEFVSKNLHYPNYGEVYPLWDSLPVGSWGLWQKHYPLVLACYDFYCEKKIESEDFQKKIPIKQQIIDFKIERKRIEEMNKNFHPNFSHIVPADIIKHIYEERDKQLKKQQEQGKVMTKKQKENDAKVSNESEQ